MGKTFLDFLIEKGIEFKEDLTEGILVKDSDLLPYELELKQLFPQFQIMQERSRYTGEPILASVSDQQ